MSEQFDVPALDLAIIGAGPGGYVAAIRAAQLGLKVALIEKNNVGGVCLNWGCIPSKNLIHQADGIRGIKDLQAIGIKVDLSGADYSKVQANSRKVTKMLTGGIQYLLNSNGVELIKGTATITGTNEVTIDGSHTTGIRKVSARNILIATGSSPMAVPGFEFDEQQVLSSSGILAMTQRPKNMIILGAGAIGCEFAYVMSSFGVEVTLIELADHILPTEDFETCAVLQQAFKKYGIKVLTQTRATSLTKDAKGVSVKIADKDGNEQTLSAEKVLVVFGRTPNTQIPGLQEVGVELDQRGFVKVGDYCQTSVPGIYAIGDITSSPALAHVASVEGEMAVEHMADHQPTRCSVDASLVPSAIYCEPQVAGFGLREDQAKLDGIAVNKSVFPYRGAGKAIAVGKPEGLVKILTCPDSGKILGAHIVGHNATELIHELLVSKTHDLTPHQLSQVIHAHPTLSETIMEAAKGVNGKPIHC